MICTYTSEGVIVGTSEGDCIGMPVSLTNDDAQNEGRGAQNEG